MPAMIPIWGAGGELPAGAGAREAAAGNGLEGRVGWWYGWPAMKSALLIVGIAAVLVGLLWIGQGTGLVHWPASSFMLDQRVWATRGAVLAVVGIVLIALSRRR